MTTSMYFQDRQCSSGNRWTQLYCLTGRCKNSLEFYREDLFFLKRLMGKYAIWIEDNDNLKSIRKIENDLVKSAEKLNQLIAEVKTHAVMLQRFIENPGIQDFELVYKRHEFLEERVASFIRRFGENRRKVLSFTERILQEEGLEHLLEK
ncbi:hypothetical protein RM553_11670 [Zunongwangia sp. F363]|uniref:Uncharacterized protein n=1 Tax=Autumnicola tepida TaxID=3075595 RepID=A0ABU3CAX0_9FLAO|nr:hypothetical protein [Zunongwangia sp. F363]MDT0643491.1 hypothetical protein [Zunongwangia sp. F363]